MSIVIGGRLSEFVVAIASFIAGGVGIYLTNKGLVPPIRKIEAIDALEEAVNRSAEMGKPLLYNTGYGYLKSLGTLASLNILSYVGGLVAKAGSKIICIITQSAVIQLADEILKDAFNKEGKLDEYNSDYSIRFLTGLPKAMGAAAVGIINREQVASVVSVGDLWAESVLIVGAAAAANCFRVGGLSDIEYGPVQVSLNNYCMIGDEIYAAGAYVTKDPKLISTVAGADIMKFIVAVLIIIGVIVGMTGSKWFSNLFLV